MSTDDPTTPTSGNPTGNPPVAMDVHAEFRELIHLVTGSLFPFASVGRLPGNSSPLLHVKVSSSHVEALKDEQHQLATELQGMTKNQLNAWSTYEKKKRLDALASFFTHFSATVADDEIKLSTPVDSAQAQALHMIGEPAPFGQGAKTLVDANVRKVQRIATESLRFDQASMWEDTLDEIVVSVKSQMSIDAPVRAAFHNLLVYGDGGHFKLHKDSEKLPGMFGTRKYRVCVFFYSTFYFFHLSFFFHSFFGIPAPPPPKKKNSRGYFAVISLRRQVFHSPPR